jgi:hypothetical protein
MFLISESYPPIDLKGRLNRLRFPATIGRCPCPGTRQASACHGGSMTDLTVNTDESFSPILFAVPRRKSCTNTSAVSQTLTVGSSARGRLKFNSAYFLPRLYFGVSGMIRSAARWPSGDDRRRVLDPSAIGALADSQNCGQKTRYHHRQVSSGKPPTGRLRTSRMARTPSGWPMSR